MIDFFDIPSYGGIYKISRCGIIKSIRHYTGNRRRAPYIKETIFKHTAGHKGYRVVVLTDKNGKRTFTGVHVLLAKTFIPNPDNLPMVRHLNDIKWDNRLENLAWGTSRDNMMDSVKNGTIGRMFGAKNPLFGKSGKLSPTYGMFAGGKHRMAKSVLDTQTGIFYDCIKEAAEAKGHNPSTLAYRLRGGLKNKTGLIFI